MKSITVEELKEKIDNKEEFLLIDVREAHEVEIATLNGVHIPMGQAIGRKDEFSSDKDVIVHCRSGARSGSVINALEQNFGFKNLYNLEGGILAWANEIDDEMSTY